MKITIDINDKSFEDYFEENNGTLDFTYAAIDMIIGAFVEKCRWDIEIRKYITESIRDGLGAKLIEYKREDVIKTIASEIIKQEMVPHRTGSIIVTDREKEKIRECVKESIEGEEMRIVSNVKGLIRIETQRIIDTVFKDNAIREFIDKSKLTDYVMSTMDKEGLGDGKDDTLH